MTTFADDLYESDFYAWTRAQAGALRGLAEAGWNGPLDLAHLAEEVEDLGSERRDAVMRQVQHLIEHLLKLEYSGHGNPRRQWLISVNSARGEIERRMTATIHLAVEEELPRIFRRARRNAALGLFDHGEVEAAKTLPEACPWPLDRLLDEDWLPANRHGLVDEI
jgi:hypothetical protein